jgi:uncharacterized protein (TIGR03435 family)
MRKRFLGLAVAYAAMTAIAMLGQTPAPKLEFEVASIKPAPPFTMAMMQAGKMRLGMSIDGARVDIGGMPIIALLPQVFRVKQYQVAGGPGQDFVNMMNTERWDILAKIPAGATQDQVPDMLLTLLVDRFKMTYHHESRPLSVYALVVGKGGSKLKDTSADADTPLPDGPETVSVNGPAGPMRVTQQGGRGSGPGGMGPGGTATITSPLFGTMKMRVGNDGAMHLEAPKMTMPGLAEFLNSMVDRPVLDMTDLKGTYHVTLDLSPQDMMGGRGGGMGMGRGGGPGADANMPSASDPSGGAIFAVVQKLGLKLDARKAPVDVIVVDHLEKAPTEN